MTKTLFWYIFGSLLKSFLMTTAGLAAMLSFAVLLRPLTENGLDFGQVCRLLLYSLPAVCAYSLPVSALFATTMVYGRFAADGEMTAMRASGISYLSPRRFSIALPALVLGLVVAVSSLSMFTPTMRNLLPMIPRIPRFSAWSCSARRGCNMNMLPTRCRRLPFPRNSGWPAPRW